MRAGYIMESITKINNNIHRLTIPYKDIFTTVYAVKTDEGVLVFDSGSYDEDVEKCIVPFFADIGIDAEMIKYVFISHNHKDHAGGLDSFMKKFPKTRIITRCPRLKEKFAGYNIISPNDGDIVLGMLKVITVPGHTQDSSAIYYIRTKTLISGDCLQLYGIFGSGNWGSNISLPTEHIEAINKLRGIDIEHILTAHDYHPYGYSYAGKNAVSKALDACVEPLEEIKNLILLNRGLDDEKICEIYNNPNKPTVGKHVVTAVREMMK